MTKVSCRSWFDAADRAAIPVAALAAVVYTLYLPTGWTAHSPLLWDQAGHFLDALRFYRGLTGGDTGLLRIALLGADQYPPLHSVFLGLWMLMAGTGPGAWLAFGLVVHTLTAYLLARIHPVAGILFVASPLLGALAPTLMVEPLACLLLVAAIRAFPGPDDGAGRAAGFALLAALVLLTKYNIGLPLLPAALVAAAVTRRRRVMVPTAIAVAAAFLVWVLFLCLQDSGWTMFMRFATNRANSAGAGFSTRLAWYGRTLAAVFLPGGALAVAVGLVAVAGLPARRKCGGGRFVLALAFVAFSLVAMGRHQYLLARNLTGPVVALLAAAGMGLSALSRVRRAAVSLILLLVLFLSLLTFKGPYRREYVERYYPTAAARLAPLSAVCKEQMARPGRTRIVGTFNEFSPGWVKILAMDSDAQSSLRVGAPCPWPRSREGYSQQWLPEYARLIAGWAKDGTRQVVALAVKPDSPYRTRDYEHWNAWKLNLVKALDQSVAFSTTAHGDLPCGVSYTVYDLAP